MNNVCILSHDQVTNTISIGLNAIDCSSTISPGALAREQLKPGQNSLQADFFRKRPQSYLD